MKKISKHLIATIYRRTIIFLHSVTYIELQIREGICSVEGSKCKHEFVRNAISYEISLRAKYKQKKKTNIDKICG